MTTQPRQEPAPENGPADRPADVDPSRRKADTSSEASGEAHDQSESPCGDGDSTATLLSLLPVLERHLADTKRAYHNGMPGVTYEDMARAAERLLRVRQMYEEATGRPVRTQITKQAIASLLR